MSRFIYYFWPFWSSIIYMQKKMTSGQINNPWLTFRDVFNVGVSVETAELDRGVSHMSSFQCVWISLLCVRQRIDTFVRRQKITLMKSVGSYQPGCPDTSETRVLLLGPVGSGKSSFISSVQSVFNGRVINRAMVGSFSTSFTKKVNVTSELHPLGQGAPLSVSCWAQLQFFRIHGLRGQHPGGLVLCDTMGLGDGAMTGPSLHDVLSIIEGFVPEGHKVSCCF